MGFATALPPEDIILFRLVLRRRQIPPRILQEAADDQQHDQSDGEGRNDGHGLKIRHGAVGENQRHGQKDQQHRPEALHHGMGLLVLPELPVAVLGRHQRNGVEGGGIKGDHGKDEHDQHQARAGQCLQDSHDGHIEIFRLMIEGKHIQPAQHLQPQSVVSEDNEAHQRAAQTEYIAAQYGLTDGPAPGNGTDEEGRRHAPDHPVGPVEHGPALYKAGFTLRIRIGGHGEEILHKTAERREARLQDIAALSAEEEHIKQQAVEKIGAGLREKGHALHAPHHGNAVDHAGHEKDHECEAPLRNRNRQQGPDGFRKQRRRHRKGRGRSRKKRKHRQEVDAAARESVGMLSQQGTAGLGIALPGPLPHMLHEAEGRRQHQIEAPGNGAPVEQRIGAGPVLGAAERQDMGILRIENPLTEGIEQNVCREPRCKHHGAPGEKAVLRLLLRCAQYDAADRRKCDIEGQEKNSETDQQVIHAEFGA